MIFIIKDVTADYIEHDIVQNGGRNTHDSYYLIQYFDFVMSGQKDFSIPDLCADEYVNLFSILAKYARRKKTLEEQSMYLFMKEAYDTYSIILYSIDASTKKTLTAFRREFPKTEWANVEDMLLAAGLAVFRKTEKRTLRYELHALEAQYKMDMINGQTTLSIKAPDEDKLIDAITVVGYSVDEGKIIKK